LVIKAFLTSKRLTRKFVIILVFVLVTNETVTTKGRFIKTSFLEVFLEVRLTLVCVKLISVSLRLIK
jgi:hypothetical protein